MSVTMTHHHQHDDALLQVLRSYKYTLIYLAVMLTIVVILLVLSMVGVLPNIETPAVSPRVGGSTTTQGSTS